MVIGVFSGFNNLGKEITEVVACDESILVNHEGRKQRPSCDAPVAFALPSHHLVRIEKRDRPVEFRGSVIATAVECDVHLTAAVYIREQEQDRQKSEARGSG